MTKKKRHLYDGQFERAGVKHYIRAWPEGRGRGREIIVQVWLGKESDEGEPDGDWGMPGSFPVELAIEQAIVQTKPQA